MQNNDINLKCSIPNHDALVQFVCFEQYCQNTRFFCIQCEKNGIHQNHAQMCFELPKFFDYVQKVGSECDDLLEILIKQWNSIKHKFQTMIEGIKKKYQISNSELIQLNFSQLNDTLEELINFQSYKSLIKNSIENNFFDFNEKIEKVEKDLKLQEKLISLHISEQDIITSQELFQKGYQLYFKVPIQLYIKIKTCMMKPSQFQIKQQIQIQITNQQHGVKLPVQLQRICDFIVRMLGQYKKAIVWADKALILNPKHCFSLYCKAACLILIILLFYLRMLDEYDEAILWANKALAIDPEDCFALSCKGIFKCIQKDHLYRKKQVKLNLRLMKRFNEAIKVINASLTINPNHFDSLKEKGCLKVHTYQQVHVYTNYQHLESLHDEHQYEKAILFYEQALSIFPGDQWTKDRLDKCLQTLKQKEKL